MRQTNAEWDFMGRTFLALALANVTLADPTTRTRHVAALDAILADTVAVERELGQQHFLMDYASFRPWVHPSGRSLFVDGEIALMAGARCLLAPGDDARQELDRRVAQVRSQMDSGPIVPVLGASAGASGHAIIGARAFGDEAFLEALVTSLQLGAFPDTDADGLTYRAGAQVADPVLLYALAQGPLWAALSREVPS